MAKVIGTPSVSAIYGSAGDTTYVRWNSKINYLKAKTHIVNQPNTARQTAVKDALATYATLWKETLTTAQRDLWEAYAKQIATKAPSPGGMRDLIRGQSGRGRGFHAFISTSMLLDSAGLAHRDEPPLSDTPPPCIDTFACVWDNVDNEIDISWVQPTGSDDSEYVRIWIRSPQNLFHKQIIAAPIITDLAASVDAVYGLAGVKINLVDMADNTIFYVQADVVHPYGQLSTKTDTQTIIKVTP